VILEDTMLNRRTLLSSLGLGIATAGAVWTKPLAAFAREIASSSLPIGKPLPEFTGATDWLNIAKPITVEALAGNVVLVHIWTFACINCQRTLPYVIGWDQKYRSQGLSVVGIHTPEVPYERDLGNVKRALQRHKITYPNAVDNQFALWKAYNNSYWPHLFLADRQGRLRYDHIGEGAYDTSDQAIRALLKEG
jgi:thiol-disulfide isomerase/thioredoxin